MKHYNEGKNNPMFGKFSNKYNITKQFLIKEYTEKENSTMKISRKLGCSRQIVENYMHKYKIRIRTNSESHSGELNHMYGKRFFGKDNPNFQNGGKTGKIYYCKICGKIVTFMSMEGLGMCKSCSHKGKLNFRFGKSSIHGKRIIYKGILMRSTWETLFAQFLELSGIVWLYESKRFDLGDCTYCPDFYLPEFDCYIEIKGWWRDNTRKRFKLFKQEYPDKNIKLLMQKDLQELSIPI